MAVLVDIAYTSCSEQEILYSYEEAKEVSELVPLSFTPYVSTNEEEEATTRADLNYLSFVKSGDNVSHRMAGFNSFPWYDEANNIGSSTGSRVTTKNGQTLRKPDYRFGKFENNSYIVGIYGYYDHNWENDTEIKWDALKSYATPNFMTNQPLKHLNDYNTIQNRYVDSDAYWSYSPMKYWPNSSIKPDAQGKDETPVNVTFVSYYPYQDFEGGVYYRDGSEEGTANLTCITPPAPGSVGESAYTFTFQQKEKASEQVDFLLGINPNESKQSVSTVTDPDKGISLNLQHTLCAVLFDFRAPAFNASGADVLYEINSVSLEGLYTKGKVYPTVNDGPIWESQYLDEDGARYTLSFDEFDDNFNYNPDYPDYVSFNKPTFDGKVLTRYTRELIYNNNADSKTSGYPKIASEYYNNNSRGMRLLMLVIPQEAELKKDGQTPKNAYLVVNYDITYTYNPGTENEIKNVFRNNEEKIKLLDKVYQGNGSTKLIDRQLFLPGRYLVFNVRFLGPKEIKMDAVVTDWDDIEEYEMSTDPVDDEDEGGGDQQGGDQQGGDPEP